MPETETIFSKKTTPNMKFESFIFWWKFHFLGDCFSKIFLRQPTMVADNFTQSPTPLHHEKASCGPAIKIIEKYQ